MSTSEGRARARSIRCAIRAASLWAALLCPTLSLTLTAACGGGDSTERDEAASPPAAVYTVRGQVVSLPDDSDGEIRLAHEAIDDFASAGGEIVGMDSMTMSFPLVEDLDTSSLAVGDVVEFDLRVDWSADDPATVTRIFGLPEGTELTFGPAASPGEEE